EVVDRDLVSPATGGEVDDFDVIEVHGHGGDVTEEPNPSAVGRDVNLLGDSGAVELHRVEAVLALDDVVVVARVPDKGIVSGAHGGEVVAVAAVDEVVALAAEEVVGTESAIER